MRKVKFVSVLVLLALLALLVSVVPGAVMGQVPPPKWSAPATTRGLVEQFLPVGADVPRRSGQSVIYHDEVYAYAIEVPDQWLIEPTPKEGWGGVAQFTRLPSDSAGKHIPRDTETDWAKIGGLRVAIGVIARPCPPGESLSAFAEAYERAEATDMPPDEWKMMPSETITLQTADGIAYEGVKQVREVMGMTLITYYFSVGRGVLFVWRTPAASSWDADFDRLFRSLRLSPETEANIENHLGRVWEREAISERPPAGAEEMQRSTAWYQDPPGWGLPFSGVRLISQGPGCWTTHQGWLYESIDYSMPVGTAVQATDSGHVIFAGWSSGGWGNLVKLRHVSDGFDSWYAHLSSFGGGIYPWRSVWQYQVVGWSGNTGTSTGPHLHFHAEVIGQHQTHWIRTLPDTSTTWYSGSPYSACWSGSYDGYANGG